MVSRLSLLALAGALAFSGGQARAETPAQGAAVVTPLGAGTSAVTYWVDAPEGFRVVTTVAAVDHGQVGPENRHAVVRLTTVLGPDQAQTISVPGPAGSPPYAMLIRRLAGGVEVLAADPATLTN